MEGAGLEGSCPAAADLQQQPQQQRRMPQQQRHLHRQQPGQQQLSQQPLVQQQQGPSAKVNTVVAVLAEVVGPELVETAPAQASPARSNPIISPVMTRARKKRKAVSPASPVDCATFIQVDGSNSPPPPSPATTELSDGEDDPQAPMEPCASSPPTLHLGPATYQVMRTVICVTCLCGCHGFDFDMCHNCFDNKSREQLVNVRH